MNKTKNTIFVGVDTVVKDLGISKPKAYKIIRELNEKLKKHAPKFGKEENNSYICNGFTAKLPKTRNKNNIITS